MPPDFALQNGPREDSRDAGKFQGPAEPEECHREIRGTLAAH